MKAQALMISVMLASPAFAANFGSTEPPKTTPPTTATVTPPKPAATPLPSGPQVTGLFRIVKPDGSTVIAQTPIGTSTSVINVINVATSDAFLTSGGKCAFNVKYDEVSGVAATNTTNRLFSNDTLIAQNTKIDLAANVLKTIWTQPYLVPGQNNVKIVINADSATPSVGWVRVNVSGTCGAAATTTPPTTTPPKTEPPKTTPPVVTPPPPPPVVKFAPGSAEWNNLYNAFGYSNYGVTQLKGKNFGRYTELVKFNADVTVVVNAKVVDQPTYNALMTRWNSFVMDPAFQAAMKAIVPTSDKK
ncbi:MAG: hypothetical protein EPO09_13655 [Aquabacterium sp.]|uniref:hypothetical protein n=1 Tax=Aquabacterium sp. TaxID=1872578 RepID=UPI001220B4F0|nr:hypothetical protein [Aquabacterium sp.]TAK93107.1 MAG: hypothetical protein EPO09_13655 [Aquabacterium sp.]